MQLRRLAVSALALTFAMVPAAGAVTVSGQVVDELGVGIFNVDLDFFDLDLGELIFVPGDNTDFGGFYSVSVPAGDYDISFTPPVGTMHLPLLMEDVTIGTNTTLNVTLLDAHLATGRVETTGGAPIANVDLDFVDVSTGDEFDSSGDNTNETGDFSVLVPEATYDIFFTPKLGDPYAGHVLFSVAVSGTTSLGTIVLQPGHFVSASVRGPGGVTPVANADLDFEDQATSDVIYTPRDNTDGAGFVNVPVPAATYDVTVKPQPTSGLAWKTIYDVVVAGNVSLGIVELETGFAVTGTVRDEGAAPVVGADLDMIEVSTGNELQTANDNTDGSGIFSLVSPATTLDLLVRPQPGSGLAAGILRNVAVAGPTNVGTITLVAGFPVTGVVRDVFGNVVPDVDIDALESPSGLSYPTYDDDTDANGVYGIRLPTGDYQLIASPPAGIGLLPDTVSVVLDAAKVVDFVLPSSMVGVEMPASPQGLALYPAAPNPFSHTTRIVFDVPSGTKAAKISVFDLAGRRVALLSAPGAATGRHTATWDGRDEAGERLASGIYFYRLETASGTITRKVTLLR